MHAGYATPLDTKGPISNREVASAGTAMPHGFEGLTPEEETRRIDLGTGLLDDLKVKVDTPPRRPGW